MDPEHAAPWAVRPPLLIALGQHVSPLTIHQATFILFAALVGLHLLARLIPAMALAARRPRRKDALSASPASPPVAT